MADASPLAGGVAGELIKSEIEIKTGRCETFAEAAAQIRERRRLLFGLADELGVGLGANGTHPFSRWQDQEIIDTPHYRDRRGPAQVRRVAQQHVRHPRPRRHPRRRPRDGGLQRAALGRARADGRLGQLAVARGPRHAPALDAVADLHAHVPALRAPRRVRELGRVRGVRAVPARRRLDPRAHRDLVDDPARTSRSGRSRSGPATRCPTSTSRSRCVRCRSRWRRGSPACTTRASRCRSTSTATSRRTSGGRSAGASTGS